MWWKTLLKYLGLPIAKLLIQKLFELWQKQQRKAFTKKQNAAVKEALELVKSENKVDNLEGVKKLEEIFASFT